MLAATLALLVGTGVLWIGGEQFVLGAVRLAERTRLPTILIGTVVAGFGTSTPELAVALLAQGRGEGELALGNALGSNVANVVLVLPLAALAASWTVRGDLLKREVLAVLGATALVAATAADGRIGRGEAAVLLISFLVVMSWLAFSALRAGSRRMLEAEIQELVGPPPSRAGLAREAVRTLIGLGVVLVSADRLVWGAGEIARRLGVSEAAIGLTIVAVGTSLPEVVTGVIAARRGEPDLVLGNVLGSNLFNALLIVGVAGLAGPLAIGLAARTVALIGVTVSALLLVAFLLPGYRVTRRQAVGALAGYASFVALLYAAA